MATKSSSKGTNQWDFLKDSTIEAIRGGQLVPFGILAIIGLILYKMPGEDVSKLAFDILHMFAAGYAVGWAGFLVVLILSFVFFRLQRKKFIERQSEMATQLDKYRELLSDDYVEPVQLPPVKSKPQRMRASQPVSQVALENRRVEL